MVIVSRFPFQHSSDNLFGRHGRQREREKKKHQIKRDGKALVCQHTRKLWSWQFLWNFPFIMNSQAQQTLCWHTRPGCSWALVKQTGPTGCLCSVTVAGFGSLCANAADFPRQLGKLQWPCHTWSEGAALRSIISWKDAKDQQKD